MQIVTVTYSRLVNLGNYENQRIDATAMVEPDETPAECLAKLEAWVEAQAGQRAVERNVEKRVADLEARERVLIARIERHRADLQKAEQENRRQPDDIPF